MQPWAGGAVKACLLEIGMCILSVSEIYNACLFETADVIFVLGQDFGLVCSNLTYRIGIRFVCVQEFQNSFCEPVC